MDYSLLPKHIQGGVQRYIENRIQPGAFLTAVICNDLKESFFRADDINFKHMLDIVRFMYMEAPSSCWGSEKTMKAWLKGG